MVYKVCRSLHYILSAVLLMSLLLYLKSKYIRPGTPPLTVVVLKCWTMLFKKNQASSRLLPTRSSALRRSLDLHSPIEDIFKSRMQNSQVNCKALVEGNKQEQEKALEIMASQTNSPLYEADFVKMAEDCKQFKSLRGYITTPLSQKEENFPIAFSIVTYKDAEQTERLLRAIYHPQNVYCIHVDMTSSAVMKQGMKSIANCFDNVFLVKNPVDIQWGEFSVLESELLCMRELWAYKGWKYYINLTGQEFPLKTNLELVTILEDYRGANNIEMNGHDGHKVNWEYAGEPPHGIAPLTGSLKITASRGFVDYVLHSKTAQDFLQWVKGTIVPDETFFQSLNGNPHLKVPGSFKGDAGSNDDRNPFLGRFVVWFYSSVAFPCHGKFVREVCVFGVKDLPMLVPQPHLFVNKFHKDFQPLAYDCLEEWHFNKTRDEYVYKLKFDDTCYRDLDFVKYQVEA